MAYPKGVPQQVKERVCTRCAAAFMGKTNAAYCQQCKGTTVRENALRHYYRNRKEPVPFGAITDYTCPRCSVVFSAVKLTQKKQPRLCDGCRGEGRKQTHARYHDKLRAAGKRPGLRDMHGMTESDYGFMLLAQGGRCLGCGRIPPVNGKWLHVDHDHACCPPRKSCGKCRRGLLCHECNQLLGLAHDDVTTLKALIGYLERAA